MGDHWSFSDDVKDKATRYLREKRVTMGKYGPGLYYVQGSAKRPYTVRTDADPVKRTAFWITCSCPHGINQGAGSAYCSHAVAVLLVIKDGIKIPVAS